MFTPDSFGIALLMMVATTVCWGSWANTYKLTKGYRFELFYWDYAIGIVLVSLVFALTLGSRAGPTALSTTCAAPTPATSCWPWSAGSSSTSPTCCWSPRSRWPGLAVAFPVAIGIRLEGVVLSYALQPKGDPMLLGLGVALAILAIIADGKGVRQPQRRTDRRLAQEHHGLHRVRSAHGVFAPFVTRALTAGRPLTPYSVAVFFTLGALLCCFVVKCVLHAQAARRPAGQNARDYFTQRPVDHVLGLLGGAISAPARSSTSSRLASSAWPFCTRSARRASWWPRSGASSSGRNSAARTTRRRNTWWRCSCVTCSRSSSSRAWYSAAP